MNTTVSRLFETPSGGVPAGRGPSLEMRRFSAGIGVITALLCTVLLLTDGRRIGPWPLSVLIRRFALLFGIDVEIVLPDDLRTTRAHVGAMLHMINEALNTIRQSTVARYVRVALSGDGAFLHLSVRDDAGRVRGQRNEDFQPKSLSERVAELRGTLTIAHPDGLNTEMLIQLPR